MFFGGAILISSWFPLSIHFVILSSSLLPLQTGDDAILTTREFHPINIEFS